MTKCNQFWDQNFVNFVTIFLIQKLFNFFKSTLANVINFSSNKAWKYSLKIKFGMLLKIELLSFLVIYDSFQFSSKNVKFFSHIFRNFSESSKFLKIISHAIWCQEPSPRIFDIGKQLKCGIIIHPMCSRE